LIQIVTMAIMIFSNKTNILTTRVALVRFSFPDVVRTLVPAVCTSLVNAVFTFDSVKHPTLTYDCHLPSSQPKC
jgi:hypothetical protein